MKNLGQFKASLPQISLAILWQALLLTSLVWQEIRDITNLPSHLYSFLRILYLMVGTVYIALLPIQQGAWKTVRYTILSIVLLIVVSFSVSESRVIELYQIANGLVYYSVLIFSVVSIGQSGHQRRRMACIASLFSVATTVYVLTVVVGFVDEVGAGILNLLGLFVFVGLAPAAALYASIAVAKENPD
ncbi:MAG: hypothetical protein AAF937_07875 [Planctomycetota bacterium]